MATIWLKKKTNKSQIFRHLLLLTTQQESLIMATTALTHSVPKMVRNLQVQYDLYDSMTGLFFFFSVWLDRVDDDGVGSSFNI